MNRDIEKQIKSTKQNYSSPVRPTADKQLTKAITSSTGHKRTKTGGDQTP